jgi:hypothetical protein
MVAPNLKLWPQSFPPRYSPAPARRPRSSISQISVTENKLAYDRFTRPKWCSFNVPATDDLIRADTRAGVPKYPIPDEHDGFIIVRRYLYNVLTSTGWGISDKYPAAVRCTVESWYGNGGFFRAQCEEKDGLKCLCPGDGKDDQGVEVSFDEKLQERIRDCVRYESRILIPEEVDIEDAASVAGSYAADGAVEAHDTTSTEAPEQQLEHDENPQDQASLLRSRRSSSVYSDAEEAEVKPHEIPIRYDSARSSTVKPDVSTSETLASSYIDCVGSGLEAGHPIEAIPSPTADEHHPTEPSHHKLPQTLTEGNAEAFQQQSPVEQPTTPTITKPSTNESKTAAIASKRSFIKRMTSVKDFAPKFTSPPKDGRPGNPKQARLGATPGTVVKPRISSDMVKTMDQMMQGKSSHKPSVKKKKHKRPSKGTQLAALPRTATHGKMPHHVSKEPLVTNKKDEAAVVAAATAAAQKARQLKLEEAKQLNHHERKMANFFSKVVWRIGGRKK